MRVSRVTPGDPSRGRHRRRRLRGAAVVAALSAAVAVAVAAPALADDGLVKVRAFAANLTTDVVGVASSVAVLFMALNGVKYVISSGNPSRQAEARQGLVSAAFGLAIALSAGAIVGIVVTALS